MLTDTGAQEQDLADPAEVDDPSETQDGPQTDDPGAAEKAPLTAQQRRENAARRRQQEERERIDAAVREAVEKERRQSADALKGMFAKAGLKNTFTGDPITTMEEFEAYQKQFAGAKLQQDLKAGHLTAEMLDQIISQHPTVKKAEEVIRSSENTRKQREEDAAKARMEAEVAKIHQLDPSISSVRDLLEMPNAQVFYDYVKRGLSLSDAYYLTNREKLEAAQAEAVRQQALNNARGKDHLRATGSGQGSGAVSVPAAEMAMFRLLNPNASEAEILSYYNKHNKK